MYANGGDAERLLTDVQEDIVAGGMILLGLVLTFSGEHWFATLVAVIAAFMGGFTTNVILSRIQADISITVAIIIILIASMLCGAIALQVKRVGVWLAGALGGLLASNLVYTQLLDAGGIQDSDVAHMVVVIVCAVIGGTLLSWLERPLERVLTSFVGAYLVVAGISHILYRAKASKGEPYWPSEFFGDLQHFECKGDQTCMILLLVWLGMFVLGVIGQTIYAHYTNRGPGGYERLE